MAAEARISEIVTGGAVLALAAAFFIYAAQTTGMVDGPRDGYELSASFRSAEGVRVGTDVRLAGVKIGTVTDLRLNPQTFRADMRIALSGSVELPEDSAIAVASEGLLGGTYIDIIPGGSPFNLAPGAEIEDTQSAVSLTTLLTRFVTGGGEADTLQ